MYIWKQLRTQAIIEKCLVPRLQTAQSDKKNFRELNFHIPKLICDIHENYAKLYCRSNTTGQTIYHWTSLGKNGFQLWIEVRMCVASMWKFLDWIYIVYTYPTICILTTLFIMIYICRALKEADVILLLGARLNWILHFGKPPRFSPDVKIIQVMYNTL